MSDEKDWCECEYCSNEGEKDRCWAMKTIRALQEELVLAGKRIRAEDVVDDTITMGSTIHMTLTHIPSTLWVKGTGEIRYKLKQELFEKLQADVLDAARKTS